MASSRRSSPLGPLQGKRRRVETVNDLLQNDDANTGQDIHHNIAQGHARVHYGNVYWDVHHHSSLPLHQSQPLHGPGRIHDNHDVGKLLDSLRFEQMDDRHSNIDSAYSSTCRWLLEHSKYVKWRTPDTASEHNGLLWIKGKPGAGKSTIMKFAYDDAVKTHDTDTAVGFFFNARTGVKLEKTIEGLYRSLLCQILEKVPTIYPLLDVRHAVPAASWSVQKLKDLFKSAVMQLGEVRLVCFIDALDECLEDEVRDMVCFFEELGEKAMAKRLSFRVLFSSRHYPHITTRRSLQLLLDGQVGHRTDIEDYIRTKLVTAGPDTDRIKDELAKRASGVFLWIVLVVKILQKEYDHGRMGGRMDALEQRLRAIKPGLSDLFANILAQDPTTDNKTLLTLQLIMFAERPLRPEELYLAIASVADPDAVEDPPHLNADDMFETGIKLILSCSKGLAELTRGSRPVVQFIHESVRDYLKATGFRMLDSNLQNNLEGLSHDHIKKCCYDYIARDSVLGRLNSIIEEEQFCSPMTLSATQEDLPEVPIHEIYKALNLGDKIYRHLPLLEYATRGVLYHAESSAMRGIRQDVFIEDFKWREWLYFDRILHAKYRRKYNSLSVDCMYILAGEGMAHLLRARLRQHNNDPSFWTPDELYESVLEAVVASDNTEPLQVLLERYTGLFDNHTDRVIETMVKKQSVKILQLLLDAEILSKQQVAQALMLAADSSSSTMLEHLIVANVYQGLEVQALADVLDVLQPEPPEPIPELAHLVAVSSAYCCAHPPADPLHFALYIALSNRRRDTAEVLLKAGVELHIMHAMALLPTHFDSPHAEHTRDQLWQSFHTRDQLWQPFKLHVRTNKSALATVVHMMGFRRMWGISNPDLYRLGLLSTNPQIRLCLESVWPNEFLPTKNQLSQRENGYEITHNNAEGSDVIGRTPASSDDDVLLFVTAITFVDDESRATLLRKYEMVELMLNEGISPDLRLVFDEGISLDLKRRVRTLLQVVCSDGNEKVAKLLLDRGANVNFRSSDDESSTALFFACKNGHLNVVRLLLNHRLDPPNQQLWPAVLEVCRNGRSDILHLLLALEIDVSAWDDPDSPAADLLEAARENGHEEIVEILTEAVWQNMEEETRTRRDDPATELSR